MKQQKLNILQILIYSYLKWYIWQYKFGILHVNI